MIAARLGERPKRIVGLDSGETIETRGVCIRAVPAAHESLERDEFGRCRFLGYLVRFGRWTVYHSGDTAWHQEIVDALAAEAINLALLPINGRRKGVAGNLDAAEAAMLALQIQARWTVPCHYGMFAFNTGSVEEFREHAWMHSLRFATPACGEVWALPGTDD